MKCEVKTARSERLVGRGVWGSEKFEVRSEKWEGRVGRGGNHRFHGWARMDTDGQGGWGSEKFEVRMAGWEGLVRRGVWGGGFREACGERLVRRAGRAHFVRRESCDSPSSPEPAAGGADLRFEI